MKKTCVACKKSLPIGKFQPTGRGAHRRGSCYACRRARGAGIKGAVRVETVKSKKFRRPLTGTRFIVTSAQNATPVDPEFFATLKVAAEHLNAELVVIPLRYKNPTSVWTLSQANEEKWAKETEPYLFDGRKKLGPNLVLVGDVKIQPTASSPLTGFESLTGRESCILGHVKMQFKAVPVPTGRFPKILSTTGACTVRNYTDSKAGKVGAFHHFLGAVIVECDGQKFWIRQINADRADGSFIDLDKKYTAAGVETAPPALGLVMGDTHVRVTDKQVDKATFGEDGIVAALNPQTLVWHDVYDGAAVNPHEVGNFFISEARRQAGGLDVKAELREMVDFVNERAKGRDAVIVDSNHHDFLHRWMIRTDPRTAGPNARFWCETTLVMLESAKMGPGGAVYADPFPYWVKKLGATTNIRCLAPEESFKLGDIECGMHGNHGPNGSRGSLKNLSRLGTRSITGHSHTPGIEEGHYQVGTSTPRKLSYTQGPGSWLNTHAVVYANGKRALLTVIDGAWRAR